MTTLNIVDSMLSAKDCQDAADEWSKCCSDFLRMKNLIPTHYVFEISAEHLQWMTGFKEYPEFCAAMGIYNNKLILILYPMDEKGVRIPLESYPYNNLCELGQDLKLQETQQYTIVKNAILSKDLQNINKNADMAFPVSAQPVLPQDKAIEAIEKWRYEGLDWLYREYKENNGEGIFKKFYVPTADLCLSDSTLTGITCSFGLRYNDIYGKMLVTLIFISFRVDLQNAESAEIISNTYDWAKPCPPVCRIPDAGMNNW